MKTENTNKYYTDEDLIHFEKLKNFNKSKVNKLNNNQNKKNPVRYAMSDKTYFDNIMNINNIKSSLPNQTEKTKKNNYYSLLDLKNFEKINQFATFNDNKAINKNTEATKIKNNYTVTDVNAFDQIIKSQTDIKKYSEDKIILKVDNKKIKIIDFNKLKEREKILKNKVGIDKIKIVYFD